MKLLPIERAILRRRILRLNVFFGLLLVLFAFAMNMTGDYNNLAEIKAADAVFNYTALSGFLYAAGSWIFCVLSKPLWFPVIEKSK